MTDRELMRQALEALGHTIRTTYADARFDAVLVNNAITALRERLAQPEARRKWVPLTWKEIAEILSDDRWQGRPEYMLLQMQARLKEENA